MNLFHIVRSMVAHGVALALLAACGGGGEGGGGGGGGLPPPPAPVTSVTQTIGPQGGTITGPNGVVLEIPSGALAADIAITIAIDASSAPSLPASGRALGPIYAVTPHGTTFGLPVTISVPFDAAQLPAGSSAVLAKTTARNVWQQLGTERSGNTLTAAATSLSWIGVFCCIDPIHIVEHPQDQTAFEGGFAFFGVVAFGVAPVDTNVGYQWLRNGVPLTGENNPTLLIPRVTLADDAKRYHVRVSKVLQSGVVFEESRSAVLNVQAAAPVIVNQPLDTEVVAGQQAFFSAASTSSVVQTLQWQRDGADIAGATAPTLAFIAALADEGALLRMCASNSGGTTCSRSARLSVIAQSVQPQITQQPQPVLAAAGASASFVVLATGGNLSYEWQAARVGASFAPYAACASAPICTISNTAPADDGTIFRVRVFNSVGSVLSTTALLTVQGDLVPALARVGGGAAHSIGLRGNGTLRAWGWNVEGQLGDGSFDARNDAVDVVVLGDVATLSVGYDHTLAIRANGEVWAWGGNGDRKLGDGTTQSRATPQPVPALAAARAVAAGGDGLSGYSLAVLADGTVRGWGGNVTGQLGDGSVTSRPAPVRVGSLTDVAAVAAGSRYALALRRDGSVWAWGGNGYGQLGDGSTTASLVPIPVPLPAPVVAIAAGGGHSLALTNQGRVLTWGSNIAGQLGDGGFADRPAPFEVILPRPAIAIAAGNQHSLALLADGRVFCWGFNIDGECGVGAFTNSEPVPRQVAAPLPEVAVAIGAGFNHSLALDATGNVWAWGNNTRGQLNDGTAAPQREAPVLVRSVNLN